MKQKTTDSVSKSKTTHSVASSSSKWKFESQQLRNAINSARGARSGKSDDMDVSVAVDKNADGNPDGVLSFSGDEAYEFWPGTSMAAPHVAGAIALMKVYKLGPEERQKRGLAGREWVLSDESGFTARKMGQGFIDNIDILLKKWKPQPRFTVIKVDDKTIPNNYNQNPISLTPEFIKEIQSI